MARHGWRRIAATVAAGAVMVLSAPAGPALAAPRDDSPLAAALRFQAELFARAGGSAQDAGDAGGSVVAAGDGFGCTVATSVSWCWGSGADGRLGTGGTGDAPEPVRADLDPHQASVTAGRAHACALSYDGHLDCWGDNTDGQVGDGTTTSRTRPVRIPGDFIRVAAGAGHTCAITDEQAVACWGRNDHGQVGTGGSGAAEPAPRIVAGLTEVSDIAAGGDTTCAVSGDAGTVACWGSDADGQVGDGGGVSPDPVTSPAAVVSDENFHRVDVGSRHTCAVTRDDAAWCWGDDSVGQLGDGPATADPSVPVEVAGLDKRAFSVSAGGDSTCAVTLVGEVLCWGANDHGQLGTGDRTAADRPVGTDLRNVPTLPWALFGSPSTGPDDEQGMLAEVSVGNGHVCASDVQRNPFCWGDGSSGQIGDGGTGDALVPVPTTLLPSPVTGLAAASGDGELRVTWTAGDTGTGKILGNLALAESDDNIGYCDAVSALGCVVRDLDNGVEYQVAVVTVTDGGAAVSDTVTGLPVGRPSTAPVPGGGGGELPITGAAVSAIIAVGGALVLGGMLIRNRAR